MKSNTMSRILGTGLHYKELGTPAITGKQERIAPSSKKMRIYLELTSRNRNEVFV